MAFQIPKYEERIGRGTVEIGTVQMPAPVADAFQSPGTEALAAGAKIAKGAADAVNEYEQKRRKTLEAEKIANLGSALSGELEALQYSNEKNDKGVPVGYLNRSGVMATGIAGDFDNTFSSLYGKYTEGLSSSEIAALNKNIEPKYLSAKTRVSLHEAQQEQAVAKNSYEANKNLNITAAAGIVSSESLSMLIDSNNDNAANFSAALGYTSESLEYEQKSSAGKMVEASVDTLISVNDIDAATKMLDDMKNKITPADYQRISETIKGKSKQNRYDEIWWQAAKNRYDDGFVNLNKAYADIQSNTELSAAEKEDAYNYVKAKAGEDKVRITQKRDADDRSFHNTLVNDWKAGQPLEETIKISAQFGYDSYDTWLKEEAVRRLYADPTEKSNPETLVRLQEGLVSGNISQGDIDYAFRERNLNSSDWVGMRGQLNKSVMGVKNTTGAEAKMVLAYINDYAESRFDNKAQKDQVKAFLYSKVQNKSLIEAKKIVDDYTIKDGWFIFGSYKAEDELKQQQRNLSLQAKFINEIPNGDAFVRGVIKGFELDGSKNNKNIKEKDINRLIQRYGADNLNDPNTPEYQAVQALINAGKPIDQQNIDFVIEMILRGSNGN